MCNLKQFGFRQRVLNNISRREIPRGHQNRAQGRGESAVPKHREGPADGSEQKSARAEISSTKPPPDPGGRGQSKLLR